MGEGGGLDQQPRLYGDRLLLSTDLLIAATALERGLTVVTRNLRQCTPTGVETINPWHQAGMRIRSRIRASGIALRKLIRSKSVAGRAVSGTGRARFRRPQPMLTAAGRERWPERVRLVVREEHVDAPLPPDLPG